MATRNPFPSHPLVHLLPREGGPCAGGLVLPPREVQGTATSLGQCCG